MNDNGWRSVPLADVVEDTIGGLWGNPPDSNEPGDADVLVVRGADFREWNVRRAGAAAHRRVPARSLERRRLVPGNIVLEVSGGGPTQPVGRVLIVDERAIAEAPKPLICSNFCRKLRLTSDVDPQFVYWQLEWLYESGHVTNFQTASTNIRNLQVGDFLKGTAVALPDTATQREVASLLDALESKRSHVANRLSRARRSIARLRSSVVAAACCGALTAEWRNSNPSLSPPSLEVSGRQERNSNNRKRTHPTIDLAPIPDGPETWRLAPLGACVEVLDSQRKPVNSTERAGRLGNVPYYGATGQVGWIDDFLFDEELVLLGEDGAPFLDKTKPIAYLISGKSWVNNHAHVLRARRGIASNRYLKYFLDAFDFTDYIQGSTRDKLTQGAMNSIPLILPPIEEQEEIVRRVEGILAVAHGSLGRVDTAERCLSRTVKAALAKAFRGELSSNGSYGPAAQVQRST